MSEYFHNIAIAAGLAALCLAFMNLMFFLAPYFVALMFFLQASVGYFWFLQGIFFLILFGIFLALFFADRPFEEDEEEDHWNVR